ncbi:uncharacterized protein [Henckelia pumila]|uniref:uncharacterized protein n=1 Tax=Henckelia pumila TaxID=405737 RepID=UPI003C6E8A68
MERGKRSTLVYIIIILLGLIALAFSIGAVQRRKRHHPKIYFRNHYDCETDAASTGFGILAFLLLFFTQIMVMVVTTCVCGGGQSVSTGGCCVCSTILLVFSWLSFLSAEANLLAAMVVNSSYGGSDYEDTFTCSRGKVQFLCGAIFAALTTIFNVFYYMCYTMTPTQKRIEQIDVPSENPTIEMTIRGVHGSNNRPDRIKTGNSV